MVNNSLEPTEAETSGPSCFWGHRPAALSQLLSGHRPEHQELAVFYFTHLLCCHLHSTLKKTKLSLKASHLCSARRLSTWFCIENEALN